MWVVMVGLLAACSAPDPRPTPPGPPDAPPTEPIETETETEAGTETEETAAPTDTEETERIPDYCDGVTHPALVINELVAANLEGVTDADGATSDWIELANHDVAAIPLAGWSLSDGGDAWPLPDLVLDPGAILMVFASGADRSEGELHASFSLSADGEAVSLLAPDGCAADVASPGPLYVDVAYGRPSAAPEVWGYFLEPTPGAPNTTESRPGFAATPTLTPPSGVTAGVVVVTATSPEPSATIRYTLDASEPVGADPIYGGPFEVSEPTGFSVVRARAFVDGLWPSRVATGTWTQDPDVLGYGLSVVSLVVDPFDLFDEETGIYTFGPADYTPYYPYFGANFWEDWERPAHAVLVTAEGATVIDQPLGVKIHGGYTRAFAQKSLRLLPGTAYGPATLDHRFFPLEAQASFEKIVLEGVGDWCPTHTENAYVDQLFRDETGARVPGLDTQAWEPFVLYLNGAFWGLYAFREKLDESWISAHFDVDPDNLDRIECTADGSDDWWRVSQGDWERFDALNAFVASHDLADPANYAELQEYIDVENLAMAVFAEGYAANADWWSNNLRMWREREDPGPFRHMVFDLGHGWPSVTYDHIGVSASFSGPGLPIADALRNPDFVALFANQASDLLNTSLAPARAGATLERMHSRIEPVIPDQYARWCGADPSAWYTSVAYADEYVRRRPDILRGHIEQHLGLPGSANVTLEASPPGSGRFHLTAVEVDAPFTGRFFQGVPVTITAVPEDGYTFVGWSPEELGEDPTAVVTFSADRTLTATFE
jgi:hypothetical protein